MRKRPMMLTSTIHVAAAMKNELARRWEKMIVAKPQSKAEATREYLEWQRAASWYEKHAGISY